MVLGFTGMFVGQLLYLLSIYLTNANLASMFQPSVPVWSALLAMLSGVEPPPMLTKPHGVAKIFGIFLAVTGAVTMTIAKLGGEDSPNEESWFASGTSVGSQFVGCICLLVQVASTATYYVIQKKYIFNQPYSVWKNQPIAVTAWSYLFGALFMALASLSYINHLEKFASFSTEAFYCLVYAIFITSTMCYLLLSWCHMQAPSTTVTASWPLQSLFCALFSFIFLHKSLQLMEFFGGSFIVCGLAAVLWSSYTEDREHNMQLNERNTKAKLPHNLDWKFSEAITEGYVVIPNDDNE